MGIFNYESKFMQFLLLMADYMILNVVYILCCIPIFTIGAAQAGLYAGIKALMNKEDDTPCLRAFFKGFRTGFVNISVVWSLFGLIILALGYCCLYVLGFQSIGFKPQLWMVILALAICIIYQSNLTIFHSSFGCTKFQLIRNVFFITLAHPLRAIIIAVLTWIPLASLLLLTPVFMQLTPVYIFFYFSVVFFINQRLMAKPFKRLTEDFLQANAETPAENIVEAEEATEDET